MSNWGTWGNAFEHRRYMQALSPDSAARRRLCRCGCRKRVTHLGMANGVALAFGCELSMRRWVRDGPIRR